MTVPFKSAQCGLRQTHMNLIKDYYITKETWKTYLVLRLNHSLVQKGGGDYCAFSQHAHVRWLSEVKACNEVKMAQRLGHQFIRGPGSGQQRSQAAC